MKPEARLLLLCARSELGPNQRADVVALLRSDLDWSEVDRLASAHGLLPLFFRHLGALAPCAAPKALFASWWARREAAARRSRAMSDELVRVLDLFSACAIDAIPYKGPTLAQVLFGDVGMREFGDLDLLVRSGQILEAKAALQSAGYRAQFDLDPALERELVRSTRHYELPFVNADRSVMVELHWRADPEVEAVPLDDPDWWSRLPRITFVGREVLALAPRELMLVLCLHGSKHFWGSLGWLADVAELARHEPALDWPWIAGEAQRLGCERRVALGLRLARDLLDAPSPAAFDAAVNEPAVARLATHLSEAILGANHRTPGVMQALRWNLALQPGIARRVGYAAHLMVTPGLGEWQAWRLPRRLHFLYTPFRALRLAAKYLRPVSRS